MIKKISIKKMIEIIENPQLEKHEGKFIAEEKEYKFGLKFACLDNTAQYNPILEHFRKETRAMDWLNHKFEVV